MAKKSKYHLEAFEGVEITLCGIRSKSTVDKLDEMTIADACARCRKIACEDCGGSGFRGGRSVGIECGCRYSDLVEGVERWVYWGIG